MTVAALYVEKGGVYYGLPDVDPWDEERDARLYAGPWPVVAHPPRASCYVEQGRYGLPVKKATWLYAYGVELPGSEDWCSFCGVNPVSGRGLCSSCQDDEDFVNCPYCHGTNCTQECEDDELAD